MKKRCTNCGALNWEVADRCVKCHAFFAAPQVETSSSPLPGILIKIVIVLFLGVAGFFAYNAYSDSVALDKRNEKAKALIQKNYEDEKRKRDEEREKKLAESIEKRYREEEERRRLARPKMCMWETDPINPHMKRQVCYQ